MSGTGKQWADPYYQAAAKLNYPLLGLIDSTERSKRISRTRVAELISSAQGVYYVGTTAIRYLLANRLASGKDPDEASISGFYGPGSLTRAEADWKMSGNNQLNPLNWNM